LKAHPVYQLRSQLIAQRREHLKLLGLKRVVKTLSLQEILSQQDDDPPASKPTANGHGAQDGNGHE
jgi:hypothetical protein